MIKIIYEQAPYDYTSENCPLEDMRQEYKEKYDVALNQDAGLYQAFDAFIKVLKVAGYQVSSDTIDRIMQDYYEYH